jgi:hypothetical protein
LDGILESVLGTCCLPLSGCGETIYFCMHKVFIIKEDKCVI